MSTYLASSMTSSPQARIALRVIFMELFTILIVSIASHPHQYKSPGMVVDQQPQGSFVLL